MRGSSGAGVEFLPQTTLQGRNRVDWRIGWTCAPKRYLIVGGDALSAPNLGPHQLRATSWL